jgi:hypothetical protein
VKETNMTIHLRVAFLAAALIYAGVSMSIIATPSAGAELIEIVISTSASYL